MVTATVGPSLQAPAAPDAFPKGGGGVRSLQERTVSSPLHREFIVCLWLLIFLKVIVEQKVSLSNK